MKNLLSLAFFSIFQSFAFAQSLVPATFVVEDLESHRILPGAMISVKQANWDTKATDGNGKAQFFNVPVGQIDYNVMKDGYQFETGQVNVSSETKNNTFRVGISKKSADGYFINGKVTDANGKELKNVAVVARINEVERSMLTDETGYFSIDIVPTKKYPNNVARVEVKKEGCSPFSDVIELNGGRTFYKVYKLDCQRADDPTTLPTGKVLDWRELKGTKISINGFEQHANSAVFHFTMENLSAAKSVRENSINPGRCELIDQFGNSFHGTYATLGNKQDDDYWISMNLVYQNPVKGSIKFDVGAVSLTKAAMLKLSCWNEEGDYYPEFVNLKLK